METVGFCKKGELLRNIRHHIVRSTFAEELKSTGWTVYEEKSCISDNGSQRRVDILAIKNNIGYIIDPTIRLKNSSDQPIKVDQEKKRNL